MRKNRNLGSDAQSWQCRTSKVLGGGGGTGGGVGGLTDVRRTQLARQLPCTCDDARMRTYVIIIQKA